MWIGPYIHHNVMVGYIRIGLCVVIEVKNGIGKPKDIIEEDTVVGCIDCACDRIERVIADQTTLNHTHGG